MIAEQHDWMPTDTHPDEGDVCEGLLASGKIVQAEWWGPVPEELWGQYGDGSGWAYEANLGDLKDYLVGWRLLAPG